MANIKGGAAIIFGGVVRIRRKIAGAAGVAVRVVQSIVSKSESFVPIRMLLFTTSWFCLKIPSDWYWKMLP